MTGEEVKNLITKGLPGAKVEVTDTTGTGDHFKAVVIWNGFAGLGLVQQHKKVFESVGEYMTQEIHALQIKTLTPDQIGI
ncbi:MAG: BolA/IbaG family iron-sulfur metabolism protein [Candidatus Marinimicrobia bacterium]|nr:BolA/IbaG family iron-sulfur metabolism protein [Candidatus Neomarinimicrobiota bacterium]